MAGSNDVIVRQSVVFDVSVWTGSIAPGRLAATTVAYEYLPAGASVVSARFPEQPLPRRAGVVPVTRMCRRAPSSSITSHVVWKAERPHHDPGICRTGIGSGAGSVGAGQLLRQRWPSKSANGMTESGSAHTPTTNGSAGRGGAAPAANRASAIAMKRMNLGL